MFPCTTATLTGVPSVVRRDADRRDAPHAVPATTRSAVAVATIQARRDRSRSTSAAAADVSASSVDRPYTPTRLAICATGSHVTWL